MEKQIKSVIQEYQKIISKLDNKLAVYEQLGTPEEIASKLNLTLQPIPESVLTNVKVNKSNVVMEAKKKREVLETEKATEAKKEEIKEMINKITPPNMVGDMKNLLAKFDKR